jgi:iron complex outermembrane receptor protein
VNYTTDSDYTISSISAYRENEYILIGDEDFSAAAAAMQTSFDEDADQFSQEFRLISPQNDVYDWVAGLYFFDSTVATSRNITFGPPILPAAALGGNIAIPSSIDVTSYAAYLHGNYRFTNDLELTFGIRFTDEEKEFDFNQVNSPADSATAAFILENVLGMPAATAAYVASQTPGSLFGAFNLNYSDTYSDSNWSPTVGLNYHANEDTMYYAKYSRGYQSGGFNGDFNPYLPAIQFNSEYVDAFELGIKSTSSDGKIRANANVFIQNYSDFQLFQRVPVNGSSVQIVSNAGEATSQGVEIESTWLVSDQFEITANVTWLDATYDKFENPIAAIDPSQPANYNGNKLNNAPDFSGYIGAQYLIPLASGASLTMNVDYSYRGDSFSNASNNPVKEYIPSYDLINTRLTYVPADNAWEASAWVQNLADDTYITNRSTASITNVDRVIYGTPRTMGIEFRYFLGN